MFDFECTFLIFGLISKLMKGKNSVTKKVIGIDFNL